MAARGEKNRQAKERRLLAYGADVVRMYTVDDLSQAEIGKVLGVSQATVGHWLKELGIPAKVGRSGEKNGRYKDGTECREHLRLLVRRHCNHCRATTQLVVHHKDGNHFNNDLGNLEVLCHSCHSRHHKNEYWASRPQQTHCIHGHPLSGDNLYVNRKGQRSCKVCRKEASRRGEAKRARRKAYTG